MFRRKGFFERFLSSKRREITRRRTGFLGVSSGARVYFRLCWWPATVTSMHGAVGFGPRHERDEITRVSLSLSLSLSLEWNELLATITKQLSPLYGLFSPSLSSSPRNDSLCSSAEHSTKVFRIYPPDWVLSIISSQRGEKERERERISCVGWRAHDRALARKHESPREAR